MTAGEPIGGRRAAIFGDVDDVWLDVQMWTGLRGNFHPFIDILCEVPEPPPEPNDIEGWRGSALATLTRVAAVDGWQPGRYHYTAERRDSVGRPQQVYVQGMVDLEPPGESGL